MSDRLPVIGIPSRRVNDSEWAPPITGVRESYVESIIEAGGAPVFFPMTDRESVLRALYEQTDGILLPGGEDINPARYGEAPHPKLAKTDDLRDTVELKLARWAFEDDKPILAVCRGAQVMNVALGGTLFQDLPSQVEGVGSHMEVESLARLDKGSHQLEIDPTSKLSQILGTTTLTVNSVHHQAIKDVAPELTVVGHSGDGVQEAIEARGKRLFLGVQCHPESLWQKADSRWLNFFKELIKAARGKGKDGDMNSELKHPPG